MPVDLPTISACFRFGDYRLTTHVAEMMGERIITTEMLEIAIGSDRPEVIEEDPKNDRGPACLILGWPDDHTPLHIKVTTVGQPIVITAYQPEDSRWYNEYRSRR